MLIHGRCVPSTDPFGFKNVVRLLGLLCILLSAGCHAPQVCTDCNKVRRELEQRTCLPVSNQAKPCRYEIPPNVRLDDGIDEDEAILTALSNNSAFQATLAQLGTSAGDSVQASLLANPQMLVYLPSGAKEGQYTLYAPIESYFLRPMRVKIANREFHRIGNQLVQNGLNVMRDARLAYIDFALTCEQAVLAEEANTLRKSIADITQLRLKDGDISELETFASRIDALNAKAFKSVQSQNVRISRARLATTIGLPLHDEQLFPTPLETSERFELDEEICVQSALACRPDLHGARWAVAAAIERARLSRKLFWRLDGVLDVRDGPGYTHTGSGLRFDLPIFNRNEGGVMRADWELNGAMHARDAIHDQIVQDVRIACRQWTQAHDNLAILENEVLPLLNESIDISRKSFADGGTDYLLILQTTTQYLDARGRILDQRAAVARAHAELERSIGRRLAEPPLDYLTMAAQTAPQNEPNEKLD